MSIGLPRERVLALRKEWPEGSAIVLLQMAPGDPAPIPDGSRGTVLGVDDTGQICVRWEPTRKFPNGRTLSISEEYGDLFCHAE